MGMRHFGKDRKMSFSVTRRPCELSASTKCDSHCKTNSIRAPFSSTAARGAWSFCFGGVYTRLYTRHCDAVSTMRCVLERSSSRTRSRRTSASLSPVHTFRIESSIGSSCVTCKHRDVSGVVNMRKAAERVWHRWENGFRVRVRVRVRVRHSLGGSMGCLKRLSVFTHLPLAAAQLTSADASEEDGAARSGSRERRRIGRPRECADGARACVVGSVRPALVITHPQHVEAAHRKVAPVWRPRDRGDGIFDIC